MGGSRHDVRDDTGQRACQVAKMRGAGIKMGGKTGKKKGEEALTVKDSWKKLGIWEAYI